ncbi:MAG: agmatine deiminase family protein [Bacteroidota bacterium]
MPHQLEDHWLMLAEWEPHEATWIGWPHNTSDWPGRFGPIPWVFSEIVRHLSRGETVRILVQNAAHEKSARRILQRIGVDLARVEFFRFLTDRGWTRDSGPMFVRSGEDGSTAIVRFRFNAWAKYPNWKRDVRVPERAAKSLRTRIIPVEHQGRPVVLEGGSIDVNGAGTILTTEECLLDHVTQVRNPGFVAEDYETVFERALGATNTIWLSNGIAGDDTHGHVDDLCRFVNRSTVVLAMEHNVSDSNHRILRENRERLQSARLEDGSCVAVVELPMPAPVVFGGQRLPASYANFYIGNAAVLVPTFNDPNDRVALGILGELFRDRPVVGIHAVDLVWGLGTLHCLTQQQPRQGDETRGEEIGVRR